MTGAPPAAGWPSATPASSSTDRLRSGSDDELDVGAVAADCVGTAHIYTRRQRKVSGSEKSPGGGTPAAARAQTREPAAVT